MNISTQFYYNSFFIGVCIGLGVGQCEQTIIQFFVENMWIININKMSFGLNVKFNGIFSGGEIQW